MIQFWNSVNSPLLNFNKLVKEAKVRADLRHLFPLPVSSLMCVKRMFVGLSLSSTNCRPLSLTMGKQSQKISCLSNRSPPMIC